MNEQELVKWIISEDFFLLFSSYHKKVKVLPYLSIYIRFLSWQRKFEFQLRLQEFIELVRADTPDSYKQAILYARKHLAPWGATHMSELQHVLATLAFKSTTVCSKYKVKFSFFWLYNCILPIFASSMMNWCFNWYLFCMELLNDWFRLKIGCLSNPSIFFPSLWLN